MNMFSDGLCINVFRQAMRSRSELKLFSFRLCCSTIYAPIQIRVASFPSQLFCPRHAVVQGIQCSKCFGSRKGLELHLQESELLVHGFDLFSNLFVLSSKCPRCLRFSGNRQPAQTHLFRAFWEGVCSSLEGVHALTEPDEPNTLRCPLVAVVYRDGHPLDQHDNFLI